MNLAKWTKEEETKLRDMWEDFATDKEIAEAIGRTEKAVGMKRFYLGLPLKERKAPKPKKRGSFSLSMVRDATAEYYPKWYIEELKRRWETGLFTMS